MLVAAISCKTDTKEDGSQECYIMTITVLKPYRRYGIASQCLKEAIKECCEDKDIKRMVLHVQASNKAAMSFYKNHGFIIEKELKDYYPELEEKDCFYLTRAV
jgi:ribosomal protein S18 acetylase RimI-like enzyme